MMSDTVPLTGTNLCRSNGLRKSASLPRYPAIYTKIVVGERSYRRTSRIETGVPTFDAALLRSHHRNLGQYWKPRRSDDVYQPLRLQHQTANPS